MMKNGGPIDIQVMENSYVMMLVGIGFYSVRATTEGMEFYDRY